MSNLSRVANNVNEIHVETFNRNRFSNFVQGIRNFFVCFNPKNEENDLPLVHAVDSVRLVYMRRIEEASLLNFRRQRPEEQIVDEIQPRIVRHRRMKQERATIEALEKALREYESKHKSIISSTRVPDSISFDKTCKITRSCQTDKQKFVCGIDRMKVTMKENEEASHFILGGCNDKWTNTDNSENTYTEANNFKKEISFRVMENIDA